MISKVYKRIMELLTKPSFVFESQPAFSDNTKAVYDEMIRRKLDKKYRLVWFLSWNQWAEIKNGKVLYFNPRDRKTIAQKLCNYSIYYHTKGIICCNTFIPSVGDKRITFSEDQKSFYLSHGTPMKSTREYYTSPGGIDYGIAASEELRPVMAREFSIDQEKYFATGFPRNDVFSQKKVDLKQVFERSFKKVIIWYPTYRQLKSGLKLKGNALPIIHNEEHARQLNETAEKKQVLIVIKPHFSQILDYMSKVDLSNIVLINDEFFGQKGITSYEMLASSDALITDYSSVYFDYTLRDKPIAVVWEDIEEYQKFPGFALDLKDYLKGAEKIYTIDELCSFVQEIADGVDLLQNERREIRDRVNFSTDGKSAQRAVDFILEKTGL